jgi:hypothetical protein
MVELISGLAFSGFVSWLYFSNSIRENEIS